MTASASTTSTQPAGPQQQARRPASAPAPAQSAPAKPRLSLKDATRGIIKGEPLRVLVHGLEGVGKTTFAANAPKCLMLGAEKGTEEVPVFGRLAPSSWSEMLALLDELTTDQHPYESIGIDSLDWLEPMNWKHVCDAAGKPNLKAFGYGDGYAEALSQWRIFFQRLEMLQAAKKMHVILVAHSIVKNFKNPDANQGDYDRYQLKLNDKAAGVAKEWAKAVLFMNYGRATMETKDGRFKGVDTGKRVIFTRMSASYDAKNRLWLPPELPLSWHAFWQAVKEGEQLRAAFADALLRVDENTRNEMQVWIEQNNYDPNTVRSAIAQMKGSGEQQQQQVASK